MSILSYPYRSPQLTEVLKPLIENKVVCDLGCAAGDLMVEFQKYAKKVIGIEHQNYSFIQDPRAEIIRGDFLETIPEAEVYYLWVHPRDVEKVMPKLKGTIILGDYDPSTLPQYGVPIRIPIDGGYFNLQICIKN